MKHHSKFVGGYGAWLVPVFVAPLFFWGLGDTVLWQDEAQTALLGRQVLRHGLPYAGEGWESASALSGRDVGVGGLLTHLPPAQAYLAAAGMALLGENSAGARIFFAIAGFLCVCVLPWALGCANRRAETVAVQIVLGTHVPFLLFARQARYYAPAALLVTVGLGAAARFVGPGAVGREQRHVPWFLGAALSFLAVTFDFAYLALIGTTIVACVFAPMFGDRRGFHKRMLRMCPPLFPSVVIYLIWWAISRTAPSRQSGQGFNEGAPDLPVFFLGQVNAFVVPLAWLALVAAAHVLSRPSRDDREYSDWQRLTWVVTIVLVFAALHFTVCTLTTHRFMRYIVPAVPLLVGVSVLLSLSVLRRLVARPSISLLGRCAVVLWLASGQWSGRDANGNAIVPYERHLERVTGCRWSRRTEVHLLNYTVELLNPPRGPMSRVIGYLRRHAEPGEVILVAYGEKPLKFHTRCRVYGGETGELPEEPVTWVWPRFVPAPWWEIRAARMEIERMLSRGDFRRVMFTGVIDSLWENRPDPEWHIFREEQRRRLFPQAPSVRLYRRDRYAVAPGD